MIVFEKMATHKMHLSNPQKRRTASIKRNGHRELIRTFRMKVDELKIVRFVSVKKQSIDRKVDVESVVCFTGLKASVTALGSVNFIEREAETIYV